MKEEVEKEEEEERSSEREKEKEILDEDFAKCGVFVKDFGELL